MSSLIMNVNDMTSSKLTGTWLNWCRLCAKQEDDETGDATINIFNNIQDNVGDSSLATAVGKYFWINIKMDDCIPKRLCRNCIWLIKELLAFTERVHKVQAMYCIMENIKPLTLDHATDIRKQCGLIDDRWQHLVFKLKDSVEDETPSSNDEFIKLSKAENEQNTKHHKLEMEEDIPEEFILVTNETADNATVHVKKCLDKVSEKRTHKIYRELDGTDPSKVYLQFKEDKQQQDEDDEEEDVDSGEGGNGEEEKEVEEEQIMQQYVYELQAEELSPVVIKQQHKRIISERQPVSCKMKIFEKKVKRPESNDTFNEGNVPYIDENMSDSDMENHSAQVKLLRINSRNMDTKKDNRDQDNVQYEDENYEIADLDQSNDDDPPNYNHNHSHNGNVIDDDGNGLNDADDDENLFIDECNAKTNFENAQSTFETFDFLKKRPRGRPTNSSRGYRTDVRYICSTCNRKYKNPNIYRKHMKSIHKIVVEQLPDFVCSICDKDFLTESRLKKHLRSHLPDEKKYTWPCPHCNRKFSQVGAVRMHVSSVHEQMKPFICDQCGRGCKTLAALNEHQLVHTTECPFECEVCKKRFKNKARLKTHMDIHAGDTYVCPDCGLKLNTRRTLQAHRLVHTDVKRYQCQFCDAAFKRAKAFKNHLILHTGMRPYKCNFCPKTFSNGSNCRSHKRKAHPKELAEAEAQGEKPEPVIIPKLEDLKSVKNEVAQPRKVKRVNKAGQLKPLENLNDDSQDSQDGYNISIYEDDNDQTEDFKIEEEMLYEGNEDCEETVVYEFIDDI